MALRVLAKWAVFWLSRLARGRGVRFDFVLTLTNFLSVLSAVHPWCIQNERNPNILLTTPTKLHSAEKRFNWRSLHLQPQPPRGLLLALILLRNVLLTSCLAENQLTSAAIAECRKTSGRSPRHLICSWTDRNYTPLVDQCDFLFIFFLFQGIQKMFSWPSHPDELTLLVFPIALLSLEIPPNASHCHLSSPPCSSFVLFCVTLETWTEGLRGKGVRRKRQLKSHPQTNVSFT